MRIERAIVMPETSQRRRAGTSPARR